MSIPFRDYLDAKYGLDERSLNPDVRAAFLASLRSHTTLKLLDLGAGTGSSLRRLLDAELHANLDITLVDKEPALLEAARQEGAKMLARREYEVTLVEGGIEAWRGKQTLLIRTVAADLAHFEPARAGQYDAIIAHALMDLLPPRLMAQRIARWLAPAGLFYATLNYDAGTTLFPVWAEGGLEKAILANYDGSMDRRELPFGDEPSAGAESGRKLHGALHAQGFDVLAYGSSDWSITPFCDCYRQQDAVCLLALLDMMLEESRRVGLFEPAALDLWYATRRDQIETRQLGMIIHQLDVLAQKPAHRQLTGA
jgi:SAM-dependent methyltransferase